MISLGNSVKLWFDVGIKRYTTGKQEIPDMFSCGLMQESKDIQLLPKEEKYQGVVV